MRPATFLIKFSVSAQPETLPVWQVRDHATWTAPTDNRMIAPSGPVKTVACRSLIYRDHAVARDGKTCWLSNTGSPCWHQISHSYDIRTHPVEPNRNSASCVDVIHKTRSGEASLTRRIWLLFDLAPGHELYLSDRLSAVEVENETAGYFVIIAIHW